MHNVCVIEARRVVYGSEGERKRSIHERGIGRDGSIGLLHDRDGHLYRYRFDR